MKKSIPWAMTIFMALMLVFSVNSFGQLNKNVESSFFPVGNKASTFTTLFEYSNANTTLPTWFGTNRGLTVMGDFVYVAKQSPVTVEVLNRTTGVHLSTLNVTGIAGGFWAVNDIEATADGVLFASNGIINNTGGNFKVYQLSTDPLVDPILVIDYDVSTLLGVRLGDKITITGSVNDGSATLYAADGFANLVYVWKMVDVAGEFKFGPTPETIPVTVKAGSNDVAPLPNGNFFHTGAGTSINKFDATGAFLGAVPGSVAPTGTTALAYLGKDGNDEMIAVYHYGGADGYVRVIRIPNGIPTAAVLEFVTPKLGTNNSTGNGDVAFVPNADGVNVDIYVLDTSDGIAGYSTNDLNVVYPVYGSNAIIGANVTFAVTDSLDVAIPNAVITLNGLANAAGVYEFTDFAPGEYIYTVQATGFFSATDTITVADVNVTETVKLAIQDKFTVNFALTDSEGAPVTNAVITFNGTAFDAGVTSIPDVSPGEYIYSIVAAGFEIATDTVTVVDADVAVPVSLMDELPRYTVTFMVEDEDGAAITNAIVTLNGVTNAEGLYEFTGMLAGEYDYTVRATAHIPVTGTVIVVDQNITETVTLIAYEVADPLTVTTLFNATGTNLPAEIGTGGNARAAALYKDRYVIVPSREGGANIWVWDMMNPHLDPAKLDMGTDIIVGGLFTINYVEVVGDDIYVSNMSLSSNVDHPFRVYRWTSLDATPELVLSANGVWGRLGDAFTIVGDPSADGSIIAHVNSDPNTNNPLRRHFRKWNFVGGVLQNLETPELIHLGIPGNVNVNSFGVLSPIEGEDTLFVATGNGAGLAIASLDSVYAYIGSNVFHVRTMNPQIYYHQGRRFLSYVVNNEGNAVDGAYYEIIDITPGATVIEALNNINTSDALNARRVHKFVIGAGAAFLSGTHRVHHTTDNELMFLSHVIARGFVLETTGTAPASYALTLDVAPAETGTVTGAGSYYEGATVPLTATPAEGYQFVNWTLGADVVSTAAEYTYTMPAAATTLMANFELIPVIEVATLAELRAKPADGTIYLYTGDAVLVAKDASRNRKFLQDATAAIMIDDNTGVITTEYNLYDVVTNVEGSLNVFRNMVRFAPTQNTAASTQNTPVEPTVFAPAALTQNDQAKLVKLENVTFKELTEAQVFVAATDYIITDGTNEFVLRTDFATADYIGQAIPTGTVNITGVIITFNETLQIAPRMAADIEEVLEGFSVTFNVDMTPASAFNPATDVVYITGTLLDWAEPGTVPANQTLLRVDNSMIWSVTLQLEEGTYFYKYFVNAGWNGGEWAGDPNREITVESDMIVNNVWADFVNVDNFNSIALNLFPNPARDNFYVTSSSMIRALMITDIAGKVVFNNIINDTETRISNNFEAGIYIVRIQTDEGVIVRKLQIQ